MPTSTDAPDDHAPLSRASADAHGLNGTNGNAVNGHGLPAGTLMWAPYAAPPAAESDGAALGSEIDWRRYLNAVLVRWWLVGTIALIVFACVAAYSVRLPKIYKASASIVIETMTPKVLTGVEDVVGVGAGGWVSPAFYETEYEVMKSRAVARRAAEKLGLQAPKPPVAAEAATQKEGATDPVVEPDPADLVIGRYEVEPERESSIVRLSVVDRDPAAAAALANAVAEAYLELNLEKRIDGTKDASTWLAVQNRDLKKKLETSEDALYAYMESHDVLNASLESQLVEVTQRLQQFNAGLAEVQAEKIRRKLDAQALKDVRSNPDLIYTLPEIQGAVVINTLKSKLVELKALQTELAARYQDAHPKMRSNDEQIAQLETTLKKEIESVLVSLDRRQASLETTESGLKDAIAAERQREARLNHLNLDYQRLKREVDTNAKLYDMVTSRMKEADITSALPFNNVRILDRALKPEAPFKPNVLLNILAGLIAGLLLGVLVTLAIEFLDVTVRTQEEVERTLAVPFLGLMPIIEDANEPKAKGSGGRDATQDRDLYVMRNPKSSPAECARFVRTNLLFMSPDKPLRSIVVTSPGPKEGKTTTAISTAIAMAQSGNRTLLIDTDMRRPRLHRVFGVANEVGISSLVVGEAKIEQAIHHTEAENLDVLPCGPIPPNPAELLHAARFKEVLAALLARYDRLIFDAPPIGAVTDPAILGAQMDGVLLVLKCEATRKDAARHALRALRDAKARVLGVVLNDVDLDDKRYGRAYYAYYRRYGGYYAETEDEASNGNG